MRQRCLPILFTLVCALAACSFGPAAVAAIDAETARQTAAPFAEAVGLPWGEEVQVELKPPEFSFGERVTVSYFGFSEVTLDATDGSIINAHDWSALSEFGARATMLNMSKEEALEAATQTAEAMGLFTESVTLKDIWLDQPPEGTRKWHVQWVRTANGIPYHHDLASVSLDPTNGKLISCGKTFTSAPPESTHVALDQTTAVDMARQQARALGFKEIAGVPPSAELKVVQPNNYWSPGGALRREYMAPSRVAWEVAITVPWGPDPGYTDKVFWIDAADGTLLGGYGYRGPTSPRGAAAGMEPPADSTTSALAVDPGPTGVPRSVIAIAGAAVLALAAGVLLRRRRAAAR